jgi:beta-xylosidase
MSTFAPSPWGDQGDGTYRNPILHADYSDPDVIRVGEDYYLTASSFHCAPGLPILHSRDLVNWELLGYALERFPDPAYDRPQHGKGVWAPALRHHAGRFWIFFGAPDEGLFVTTASRPEGPWTPLHCLRSGKGLIDPCPFWDDDGSAWLIRAQAGSRCEGVNSLLTLHAMAPDGSSLLDDGVVVIDGHHHHPIIEGPKLYKRNGYYYIFAPAGGVRGGWQAVFRSRHLRGPYEDRIVLCQGNTPINGPHQGGWVDTPFGEDWFVHFQDRGPAGRVVHLQPLSWEEDWPLIGEATRAREVYEPVLRHPMPRASTPARPLRLATSDDFAGPRLGLQWQWMANPRPSWHAFEAGGLRLHAEGTPGGRSHWFEAGNLLLQKPQDAAFRVTTRLRLEAHAEGDHAGLILTGGTSGAVYLEAAAGGPALVVATLPRADAEAPVLLGRLPVETPEAWLRLEQSDGRARFSVSTDGVSWSPLGDPVIPSDAAWMGAKVGLFCLSRGRASSGGSAVFSFFHYEPIHD